MAQKVPRVGIAVFITRKIYYITADGNTADKKQILLGKRIGSRQSGTYAPPGGHLEFGEEPEDCARREVLEETGLHLEKPRYLCWLNDVDDDMQHHYLCIIYTADVGNEEPENLEKNKCEGWKWFDMDSLPDPLFSSVKMTLKICPGL